MAALRQVFPDQPDQGIPLTVFFLQQKQQVLEKAIQLLGCPPSCPTPRHGSRPGSRRPVLSVPQSGIILLAAIVQQRLSRRLADPLQLLAHLVYKKPVLIHPRLIFQTQGQIPCKLPLLPGKAAAASSSAPCASRRSRSADLTVDTVRAPIFFPRCSRAGFTM